jgi:hypothetical protein
MLALTSPYHRWNLTRNPFGEWTRAERAELAVVEHLDVWIEMMNNPRVAIEFVGDCGFGKTTHLLALMKTIPNIQYVYYPPTGRRPALPRWRPLLIDEAQRMGYFRRREMLRGGGPIAIGSHISLSSNLRKSGFEVTTVNVELPMSPTQINCILNRRIQACRLNQDQPLPLVDEAQALQLSYRFGGNLRRIEDFLYEQFQASIVQPGSFSRDDLSRPTAETGDASPMALTL